MSSCYQIIKKQKRVEKREKLNYNRDKREKIRLYLHVGPRMGLISDLC